MRIKPIFTKKNIIILGVVVSLAGFVFSGMAYSIWKIITGEGEISEEVRLTAGAGFLFLGPWIIRLSSFFGGSK